MAELAAGIESCVTPDGVIRKAQADLEALGGGPWDGRRYSYIPRHPLPVPKHVSLHDEFERELDPITYQVLRSRFWHLNLEHGDVLVRSSGSMVIVLSLDFATCLLTENGDIVTIGPTIQYFSAFSDLVVKWTLENRGNAITDGDIFMQNDPFVGTAQQSDTALYAPVFWEGKIFCWVYNCSHIGDLGGVDAGGWAINARDIYDEGVTIPPIKIVSGGEIADDLVEAFARQSRDPRMITQGVRSAVAAIEATRRKVAETLQKYGAPTVKGAMRRMIADTSRVLSERLSRIPDGVWRERMYLSGIVGEGVVHQEVLSLTKQGDRLIISNEGTSPQAGPGNTTYAVTRSAVISAISTHLAHDQLGCIAGVANHVMFKPEPATRNFANHPAACSAIVSAFLASSAAGVLVSKMILSGEADLRAHANGVGALGVPMGTVAMGMDEHGDYVGVDAAGNGGTALAGGLAAFPYRDGIDAGGSWWLLGTTAGNVEDVEAAGVSLTLYRRENPDSGGPGRWRGGNGASHAIVPHKVHMMIAAYMYSDPAVNTVEGIGGGGYGLAGNFFQVHKARELLDAGVVPSDRTDLEGAGLEMERIHPRALVAPVPHEDCLINEYNGGGGYGDPLQREPERVRDDVREERISAAAAERHWGVVLDDAGAVDDAATQERRDAIRTSRLEGARRFDGGQRRGVIADAEILIEGAAGGVDLVQAEEALMWACSSCGESLGSAQENFKLASCCKEEKPNAVDAHLYPDPSQFGDGSVVLRRYFCPGCATLLAQEFARRTDDPLCDFSIHSLPRGK